MTEYGKNIKIRIYGGSHDEEIGVIADGIPGGIDVDLHKLQEFLNRRAPGRAEYSTSRKEADVPKFVSGIYKGKTNRKRLHAVIKNKNARTQDYDKLSMVPRPSHADYPAIIKFRNCKQIPKLSGGGHFSGRLTAPLCVIGGILKAELERLGIFIGAHVYSIGDIHDVPFDPLKVDRTVFDSVLQNDFPTIDHDRGASMIEYINKVRGELDSVGGIIECAAVGLPAGIGEHMFYGMEGRISQIVFSIPAVKGVEFGSGFAGSGMRGSENNDQLAYTDGKVTALSNNSGGIQGGMTNGMPIILRAAIKPTPSIGKVQKTVDLSSHENTEIRIEGRHDPCIVPRAVPVIEAAAAIAIFDAILDEGDMEV